MLAGSISYANLTIFLQLYFEAVIILSMTFTEKIKKLQLVLCGIAILLLFSLASTNVGAANCENLRDDQVCCGGVATSFDFGCPDNADTTSGQLENNPIFTILLFAINFLTAGIGIAAVGFITWGAIIYSTAGGNREKVQTAISYITNAVIGLLLFMSMFAIANFLIPGGVFN